MAALETTMTVNIEGLPTVLAINPGSIVDVVAPGIKDARVLSVNIKASGVTSYEIVWWVNGSRSTAWVDADEIAPVGEAKQLIIGFV